MPVSNPHAPLHPSAPPSPSLKNCSATSHCSVPAAWFRFGKFLPNSFRPAPCHRKTFPSGVGVHLGQVRLEGKGVMRPLEGLAPPPIGAQRYPQKEAIFFQERVFQKCANAEREDGHFHHPCQSSDVVHVPTGLRRTWRKRCIRDSCEGEAVAEGSPLAQPLLTDTPEPDPETQPLSRQPDKVDGLSLSTPTEEGGRRLKESDEENGKEAKESSTRPSLRTLNPRTTLCQNEDEMDPPWFCSTPIQTTEDDAKDDGYEEFRRRLGMELAEPVPCHQRKKVHTGLTARWRHHAAARGQASCRLCDRLGSERTTTEAARRSGGTTRFKAELSGGRGFALTSYKGAAG
ncbi:uncharacterized protein LOC142024911 isoform X2 [Carettochelys insculpta]|uniref:uncharacterized protein LOC142024911 isoform X2 n=1 Tax=Carettochelys insculpta TaxID=44489 RepID=UPI003EBB1E48